MDKIWMVYMLASRPRGALYIGMTGDIQRRTAQNVGEAFGGSAWAKRYKCDRLVYVERCDGYEQARSREIQLKRWERAWKDALVERTNPHWNDLSDAIQRMLA